MVFVKGNWLFCADNCDGQLRWFLRGCASTLDKRVLTLTHHMGEGEGKSVITYIIISIFLYDILLLMKSK
uniref:Uncharacterized protein n=1 Tax=Picea glauca TaxID=3330 RepID=A0A101LW49_PICGL|nr:hypothetical protein ABT39_MTgene1553 [Picea glauca]